MGRARGEPGHAVDHVHDQVEPIEVVEHHHVEGRGRGALLFVAAHVQLVVVAAAVGQPEDQPGVAGEGHDHRPVHGEYGVELEVVEPVRVLGGRLQLHQVYDVDEANPDLGQVLAQ